MNYVILALAGRQFMVKEGDVFTITRQQVLEPKVLFYRGENEALVGAPFLENVKVELEKISDEKDEKVVVARFKAKSRHRRKVGHRQPISKVKVVKISKEG